MWTISGTAPLGNYVSPGNSYFASLGSSLEYDASYTGGPPNGVFAFYNLGVPGLVNLAGITDGTSNTVAFGEWRIGTGNLNAITIPQDAIYLGTFPPGTQRNTPQMSMAAGAGPFMQWLPTCAANASNAQDRTAASVRLGESWAFGLFGVSMGNVLLAPNPKYPNCSTTNTAGAGGVNVPAMATLSSYHPGGGNVVMCDGSVRFLKDSINLNTIWALGSRSQGEVISADSY